MYCDRSPSHCLTKMNRKIPIKTILVAIKVMIKVHPNSKILANIKDKLPKIVGSTPCIATIRIVAIQLRLIAVTGSNDRDKIWETADRSLTLLWMMRAVTAQLANVRADWPIYDFSV